jgi:hypothetical protein
MSYGSQVEQRGGPNSSASSTYAVNLMVSFWKWTGWILPIFYRQLLLAATTKVSEFVGNDRYNRPHSRLWKAFVIGRVSLRYSTHRRRIEFVFKLPALLRQMDDLQSGGGAEGVSFCIKLPGQPPWSNYFSASGDTKCCLHSPSTHRPYPAMQLHSPFQWRDI